MYVLTAGHHEILGFGLTPQRARVDAARRVSQILTPNYDRNALPLASDHRLGGVARSVGEIAQTRERQPTLFISFDSSPDSSISRHD